MADFQQKGKTSRAFAWSFLEQGASKVIALIVQIVLARMLAPEAFGVLAILLVITQVADSIAQSGLGMALIQKSDATSNSYSTGWWLSLGIAIALYLIIFTMAPAISAFYEMAELSDYLRVLGLVIIANAANSIQRSWLQRSLDFRGIFKVSLTAIVLSGAVGIGFALNGFGVWALVLQMLSQSVFTLAAMFAIVPWKPRFAFNQDEAIDLFRYGWKICVTGILNVLYTGISELVIGRACSATSLGYYSQGRKYPMAVIGVATNAIQNVMFPALTAIKDDRKAFCDAARKALRIGTFLISPMAFCAAALAEPLVAILLTEAWLPCVPIFQMVCISHCIIMSTAVNLRAYMALGHSGLYLKLQVVKVAIGSILICFTAVSTKDIYLTALATFATTLFNAAVVDPYPAKRIYEYPCVRQALDIAPTLAMSAAAAAISIVVGSLIEPYVPKLFAQLLAFFISYLSAARIFTPSIFFECVEHAISVAKRREN